MKPDRGILCTYRHSSGLSTRPYDPNTLTRQSSSMNYAPRDLLHGPITHVQNRAETENSMEHVNRQGGKI